jgi:hypothetical protein
MVFNEKEGKKVRNPENLILKMVANKAILWLPCIVASPDGWRPQ